MVSIHRYRIKCLGQKACCQFAVQTIWLNLNIWLSFWWKRKASPYNKPHVVYLWQHKLGRRITVLGGNFCKLLSGYNSQCWITYIICPSGVSAVPPFTSYTALQILCQDGWVLMTPLLLFRDDHLHLSLVLSCQSQVKALSFPGLSVD